MEMEIGIDIGGTKILLIAKGEQIEQRYQCGTGVNFTPADAEAIIANFIQTLPQQTTSIGIAVPGLVDRSGRVIACDVLPQIEGWLPSASIDEICPIRTINDAEAALAKTIHGLAPASTTVVIMVGTGIGASFYVNGQVLRGARGWAGELGNIPISTANGIVTLDRLASGAAILQRCRERDDLLMSTDIGELLQLIEHHDQAALRVVSEAEQALGLGIATIINIFNPNSIVLAGGAFAWAGYLDAALASAQQFSLPDLWAANQVQQSPYGADLVALGAALVGRMGLAL